MRRLMYFIELLGILGLLFAGFQVTSSLGEPSAAYAADRLPCSSPAYVINEQMPNGARWAMCWEERSIEGIVLRSIQYSSPTGEIIYLLSQANLAQIFVPYDSGYPRLHDLSDFGLGGSNMNNMAPTDCPGGTLLQNNGRNVLCKQLLSAGYGYKYYGVQKQAAVLKLFTVAHIGAYNYINQWKFYDDGTIEPAVGATGQLQFCTSNPTYGWLIEGKLKCTASGGQPYGQSHIHTYYWRLDFDIQQVTGNVVEQLEFAGSTTDSRELVRTQLSTETSAQVDPHRFRSWRIGNPSSTNAQGHMRSYELIPNSDHIFRGPGDEPWTHNDLFVTQYKPCEIWASHNSTLNGCADNVSGFVNSEVLSDPILWYGLTFHHLPRDEDDPHMSAHWSSFLLVPRDMFAEQQR